MRRHSRGSARATSSGSDRTCAALPARPTSYEPDREYVDGQLVERHVGEYFHSRLQFLLAVALGARERERRFRVSMEQRVRFSDEPRCRIPDNCVKALPHAITPILTRPDLAIEIVSPDDEIPQMLTRVAAGVPYIWIVDRAGIRQPPLVGEIDFAALFGQLAEPGE